MNGWLGHLGVEVRAGGLVLVPLGAQRRAAYPLHDARGSCSGYPLADPGPDRFWPDERGRTTYLATRVGVAVREDQATIVRRASSLG